VGSAFADAVVDDCTRECLALEPDASLLGRLVARGFDRIIERRGEPAACISDTGLTH
jgi:putative transposase